MLAPTTDTPFVPPAARDSFATGEGTLSATIGSQMNVYRAQRAYNGNPNPPDSLKPLPFKEGELIEVMSTPAHRAGWFEGRRCRLNGDLATPLSFPGWFPDSYVVRVRSSLFRLLALMLCSHLFCFGFPFLSLSSLLFS